tara:strand:- start:123 stop:1382 length:1260 start_codon:yes stop_codon:yes gene_type:complete
MGSTFVKMNQSKKTGKGAFSSSQRSEIFLQFVPGQVIDVATSKSSKSHNDNNHQNSIFAKSHIKESPTNPRLPGVAKRYFPLLRGQVDVPVIGDPVLLCDFGGVNYYLGPLNTQNSPNFNIDQYGNVENNPNNINVKQNNTTSGESPSFIKSEYPRMSKPYIDELDDPKQLKKSYKDIHGDMMFEGRHGNSIRIGSRNQHPIFMISNGRSKFNNIESLNDGSILSMTDKGSLLQHFQFDAEFDESVNDGQPIPKPFKLASDSVNEAKRFIGDDLYNYGYNEPQTLLSSNKITINSTVNDIVLSSRNNLLFGSGNTIQIISNNSTTIESSNIYLGKHVKMKHEEGKEVEPLVLGLQLKNFLIEVIDVLKDSNAVVNGAALPLIDSQYKPLIPKWEGLIRKLKKPEFVSQYHFIEDNEQKQ